MKRRRSNPCLVATPAGVVRVRAGDRVCRCAQPPANRSHPSGMGAGHAGTLISAVLFPANGWHPSGIIRPEPEANRRHPSGMTTREPGGFKAISRWSRRTAPTPPGSNEKRNRIPEGCQPWEEGPERRLRVDG